jgi:hypothetical protein
MSKKAERSRADSREARRRAIEPSWAFLTLPVGAEFVSYRISVLTRPLIRRARAGSVGEPTQWGDSIR